MSIKKHPQSGPTSSSSGQPISFNDYFRDDHDSYLFDNYFSKCKVNISRILDLEFLAKINFQFLDTLANWYWVEFLKICSPTFANLVRAFYSNDRLENDET
ncbi:hypothetical protein Gohar_006878, partial [Gossypium harknessii]|nr:hypothetical protein [Gossypium harknessii]